MTRLFKAGDIVKHRTSGEKAVVVEVEPNEKVYLSANFNRILLVYEIAIKLVEPREKCGKCGKELINCPCY